MLRLSNIQTIDFAKLYQKQKEKSSFKTKSSKDWNKKAKYMNYKVFNSIYIKDFLKRVKTKNMKTLLDVGCGPGTFGICLANEFKRVYCLDFSPKMLKCVKENAKARGIKNIKTIQKSFEDDWSDIPKVDILIASRCMEVEDLEKTLKLLNSKAKKVYISYKVGGSFIDNDILENLSQPVEPKPDFIYLINILYQMGINAKVDFIRSENTKFQSKNAEEFLEKVKWSLGDLSEEDKKNLPIFYEQEYKHKKQDKYVKWALISYKT